MTLPIIGTAAVLAGDMLSFLVSMYENASTDSERLDIILRYSTVMRDLQRAINKAARARERKLRYPGRQPLQARRRS